MKRIFIVIRDISLIIIALFIIIWIFVKAGKYVSNVMIKAHQYNYLKADYLELDREYAQDKIIYKEHQEIIFWFQLNYPELYKTAFKVVTTSPDTKQQ